MRGVNAQRVYVTKERTKHGVISTETSRNNRKRSHGANGWNSSQDVAYTAKELPVVVNPDQIRL